MKHPVDIKLKTVSGVHQGYMRPAVYRWKPAFTRISAVLSWTSPTNSLSRTCNTSCPVNWMFLTISRHRLPIHRPYPGRICECNRTVEYICMGHLNSLVRSINFKYKLALIVWNNTGTIFKHPIVASPSIVHSILKRPPRRPGLPQGANRPHFQRPPQCQLRPDVAHPVWDVVYEHIEQPDQLTQ